MFAIARSLIRRLTRTRTSRRNPVTGHRAQGPDVVRSSESSVPGSGWQNQNTYRPPSATSSQRKAKARSLDAAFGGVPDVLTVSDLKQLVDAYTRESLRSSSELYVCENCSSYYHAHSLDYIRRKESGCCINCNHTKFRNVTIIGEQQSRHTPGRTESENASTIYWKTITTSGGTSPEPDDSHHRPPMSDAGIRIGPIRPAAPSTDSRARGSNVSRRERRRQIFGGDGGTSTDTRPRKFKKGKSGRNRRNSSIVGGVPSEITMDVCRQDDLPSVGNRVRKDAEHSRRTHKTSGVPEITIKSYYGAFLGQTVIFDGAVSTVVREGKSYLIMFGNSKYTRKSFHGLAVVVFHRAVGRVGGRNFLSCLTSRRMRVRGTLEHNKRFGYHIVVDKRDKILGVH